VFVSAVFVSANTGVEADIPNGCVPNGIVVQFVDVTGDRRLMRLSSTLVALRSGVLMARGSRATKPGLTSRSSGAGDTYFSDVTGDGRVDAIVVNEDRVTVRRSSGKSFTANQSWTNEPYFGNVGSYFADVNGDSRADAIVVNTDRVTVRLSNGMAFSPNQLKAEFARRA